MDLHQVRLDFEEAAKKAGAHIKKHMATVVDKGKQAIGDEQLSEDKTTLTELDEQAQIIILKHLLPTYAFAAVFAEESSEENDALLAKFTPSKGLLKDDYTIIIDPIDGTSNLLNQNPANHKHSKAPIGCKDDFGVSISLAKGKDIVVGAFHYPSLNKTISAAKGLGTFFNGERAYVPSVPEASVEDPIRISGSCKQLRPFFPNQKHVGSSVAILLQLLTGEIKAYVRRKNELIDFAATELMLKEAGGFMGNAQSEEAFAKDMLIEDTDPMGKPRIIVEGFLLLSSTQGYHKSFLELLKQCGVNTKELFK